MKKKKFGCGIDGVLETKCSCFILPQNSMFYNK